MQKLNSRKVSSNTITASTGLNRGLEEFTKLSFNLLKSRKGVKASLEGSSLGLFSSLKSPKNQILADQNRVSVSVRISEKVVRKYTKPLGIVEGSFSKPCNLMSVFVRPSVSPRTYSGTEKYGHDVSEMSVFVRSKPIGIIKNTHNTDIPIPLRGI